MVRGLCLLVVLAALGGSAQADGDWKLRLVGGNSSKQGTVEVFINGTWGNICEDAIEYKATYVICKALGQTQERFANHYVRYSYFGEGSGNFKLNNITCSGEESTLQKCNYTVSSLDACPHSRDAGVVCDYTWHAEDVEVRLVGGTAYDGRVEVFYNGIWGSVCGSGWDLQHAKVICRQLGRPDGQNVVAEERASAQPGSGSQKFHLYYSHCVGTESNIGHCSHYSAWGSGLCFDTYYAGVACLDESGPWQARLVGGAENEGRVEVSNDNDTWTTICDEDFDDNDAKVICKMLGHNSGNHYAQRGALFGPGSGLVNITRLRCTGSESSISNCRKSIPDASECPHARDASIVCNYYSNSSSQPASPTEGKKNSGTSRGQEVGMAAWLGALSVMTYICKTR